MKKRSLLYALSLVMLISCLGCTSMAQRGALSRAHSGISKGKYEFALKRLTEAEHYVDPKPDIKAEISFLKAVCYEGLGQLREAKAHYNYVADRFPDTVHGYRAKEKLKTTSDSVQPEPGAPNPAKTQTDRPI